MTKLPPKNDVLEDGLSEDDLLEDSLEAITSRAKAKTDISHIHAFLGAKTSKAWLSVAKNNLSLLMQDHANCEKRQQAQR